MNNSDTKNPPRSTDTRNYNEPSNEGLEKCDCSMDNNCGCTYPNNIINLNDYKNNSAPDTKPQNKHPH